MIMRRRLLNLLTAFSLLLAVAIIALKFRSERINDHLSFSIGPRLFFVTNDKAGLKLALLSGRRFNRPLLWTSCRDRVYDGFIVAEVPGPRKNWSFMDIQYTSNSMSAFLNRDGTLFWSNNGSPVPVWSEMVRSPYVLPSTHVLIRRRLALIFFSILPLVWIPQRMRVAVKARRRRRLGLCAHCGYDLKASSERCPECGTAIPSPPATHPTPSIELPAQ